MPPLKGVVCNFCKDSPHLRWHQVLSFKTIEEKLAASDYRIKKIRGFRTEGKDESGRITRLKIIGENKTVEMPAKDFRSIIGPNIIRSTNFSLQIIGPDVIFEGLGWGHGVGLCQWGAYFMAKQGYNYEEILKYYYPQTDVKALGF